MRFWIVTLACSLAAATAGWHFTTGVFEALERPGTQGESRFVLREGSSLDETITTLARQGLVTDPLAFRIWVILNGNRLQAGEYAFPARVSMDGIAARISSGETVVRRLTIPEGWTVRRVLGAVAAAGGLTGELPPPPPEGSLMPETYFYKWGDQRAGMIERMRRQMDRELERAWEGRWRDLPLETPQELLILASIIERETGRPGERTRIASVFVNRLRAGMRLQSDPTVIYGLSGGEGTLGRPLTRADLRKDTPWNTYTRKGLPGTPISNPGRSSLQAAARPGKDNLFYFVADGEGGHVFARNLDQHNRNVARYRASQREGQ